MEDIVEVGIWTIHKDGIKGISENFTEVHIDTNNLWTTTTRKDKIVWDWPVQFAEKGYCDEEQAVNLVLAMEIAREKHSPENPEGFPIDIDEQTIRVMMEIIDDKPELGESE